MPTSTVRVCRLAHPVRLPAALGAALGTLVISYTRPGDRVLLADAPPAWLPARFRPASGERRDQLVRAVSRLGRHPATDPTPHRPRGGGGDHCTEDPNVLPTYFELIIVSMDPRTPDTTRLAAWAAQLTPTGTLTVLTHSHRHGGMLTDPAPDIALAATAAGLVLVDRLILLHQQPHPPGDLSEAHRRSVILGGHRPIHSTVLVFTRAGERA